MGHVGTIGYILWFYWDHGIENGNYYNGLCGDYGVYTGLKSLGLKG